MTDPATDPVPCHAPANEACSQNIIILPEKHFLARLPADQHGVPSYPDNAEWVATAQCGMTAAVRLDLHGMQTCAAPQGGTDLLLGKRLKSATHHLCPGSISVSYRTTQNIII